MELLTLIYPTIGAVILIAAGAWFKRRMAAAEKTLIEAQAKLANAQAESEEGNTSKSLSETAKIQIETYTDLIVTPLKEKLNDLSVELEIYREKTNTLTVELGKVRAENGVIKDELFYLKVSLKQVESSLDYLINEVKSTFPDAVDRALKIRKGEITYYYE